MKMAMDVKNRSAYYQNNCRNYHCLLPNCADVHQFAPKDSDTNQNDEALPNKMCQQQPFEAMSLREVTTPSLRLPLAMSLAVKSLQLPAQQGAPAACPRNSPPLQEEAPQSGGEQDLSIEELCKPLYCKLCNVTLNSAQQAQAHYQGKNHSKKLRNFYAGNQQCTAIRSPEGVEPQVLQVPSAPAGATTEATTSQSGFFKSGSRVILATEDDYCKLCDASFSSPAVAQAHYHGKNHAKRLRLAEAQQNNAFIDTSETNQRWTRKEGSELKVMKARRNMHVPQNIPGPYYNPRPRQRIPRDLAMCVTPSGQFYCSMCNSGASEETEFRLHLESKQHKSKVSEQRYRSEMENLGPSGEPST
ncbi:zinc finger matrin-type protein 3 isoform X2 [Polypterus senegalus]|uniref:zinc finger matrin-type protein 3 isoform X2 n=1 Tax=Polypterus senegalus TaxID=55291 RepID=UPI0019644412|nr:zinc finger matrin-type protein 3 isoform X2 [Polypterus senegalus]